MCCTTMTLLFECISSERNWKYTLYQTECYVCMLCLLILPRNHYKIIVTYVLVHVTSTWQNLELKLYYYYIFANCMCVYLFIFANCMCMSCLVLLFSSIYHQFGERNKPNGHQVTLYHLGLTVKKYEGCQNSKEMFEKYWERKGWRVFLLCFCYLHRKIYLFVYMRVSFQDDISETMQGCVMPLDKAFGIMEVFFQYF